MSTINLGSSLTYGGSVEEQGAIDCIHTAYDLGITFFDTANAYARGQAKEVVGRALKDFPRDPYVELRQRIPEEARRTGTLP